MSFEGSCHCGAISYTCKDNAPESAVVCNCSICSRKGSVLHFVPTDRVDFEFRTEPTTYRFNREIIAHKFCPTCGIATHAEVSLPDKPTAFVINLRTADIDLDAVRLDPFDGKAL